MDNEDWLKTKGFANVTCFGDSCDTYENKPLKNGGIRIEIHGDISVVTKNIFDDFIPTSELRDTVSKLLEEQKND